MSTRRGGRAVPSSTSHPRPRRSAARTIRALPAAKAGVDALTIGLAKELAGEGIRVNAVAPGLTRTDIHRAAGAPDRADQAASRIPLGRPAEPLEIAAAIAWLLGPAATYVTGAVLRVAGGISDALGFPL